MDPDTLVQQAYTHGVRALALTDINNTSGWYDFMLACQKLGIKPVLGVEFRPHKQLECIMIARNKEGVYAINYFLSNYSCHTYTDTLPMGHKDVFCVFPWGSKQPDALPHNCFLGIRISQLRLLYNINNTSWLDKLVLWLPITYSDATDYDRHKVLQAIDQNTLLSKLNTTHIAHGDEYFSDIHYNMHENWEHGHLLAQNARRLLDECTIAYDLSGPKNKKSFTGSKFDDRLLLEKLALEGYRYRYGTHAGALERVKKELKIIDELDFSAYFLITWDILRYAESRGFHWVGRGSGANSIVAYCLKISNVDPIALNLYFERFINPYRSSPPDFDIDFSWDERDDIIDYIFKRYGKGHVCFLATYHTLKGRSVVRELGKVYGLPKAEQDILVNHTADTEIHHGLSETIFEVGQKIAEFPDHLSIHAGGILITEEPLYYYTALDMMPKGFPVCHFDMHVAEDWGFYKFDILSQRGLGHIKEAVEIIRKNREISVDIHRVHDFFADEAIRDLLRSARTMGCFYIESPAMRGLLSKLRCDNFVTLVAASSIIRPGVAKSGMMKAYIARHHNPENISYIHPIFAEILRETYGVMVYQEDVIKIAHYFAGLDLGEADILRRGMSGKSRSKKEFLRIRSQFFANCSDRGYPDDVAHEVWRQIESFSGYSFCKAHSASFAVESYQSLFLKTYFPLEFMVAVINNFGGFYDTEFYVHEARMCGASVWPPCVNNGCYKTTIKGKDIYIGFIHIKGMDSEFGQRIEKHRDTHGAYTGLPDFIARTGATREQLNLLIRIDAFRFTRKSKQALLWEKNDYLRTSACTSGSIQNALPFVESATDDFIEGSYEVRPYEDAFTQMELLGFPLCSPFALIREKNIGSYIYAHQMNLYLQNTVRMLGYYVTRKDTKTHKGQLMNFATWIDEKGHFFDTVHFPPQLHAYPFTGKGCYLILGKVVEEFGFYMLEVRKMIRLPFIDDPRF